MMVNMVDKAKRMMGWCPNASAIKTKEALQFVDLPVNAPDRGGKITHVGAGWLNKYRNRVLLQSLLFIYLAVVTFDGYGKVNLGMYLIGAISGLFFHLFIGMKVWHSYNRAAVRGIARTQTTLKQKAIAFLVIISLIVFFVFVAANITGVMAFISGTMLFVWIEFLEVFYWEQKNGKTLIMDKTSFYAVDVEAGGSK